MNFKTLNFIVLTFAGYWLFGRLASLFVIPPGFASPIWPAAGFAFLMVYRFGVRLAIGVLLASAILNVTFAQGKLLPFSMVWLTGFVIALGATIQVIIARFLVWRFIHSSSAAPSALSSLYIGIIAGPISCVVSPSVGLITLILSGNIQQDEILRNWVNWWVGDTIGVMVFAPVIFVLDIGYRHIVGLKRKMFLVSYLALIGLATALFLFAKQQETTSNRRVFEEQARGHFETIHHQILSSSLVTRGVSEAFETFGDISWEQFQRFSEGLYSQVPGINAISWIPIIESDKRYELEERLSVLGGDHNFIFEFLDGKVVKPVTHKNRYFPVTYIYPIVANRSAVGFDLSSNASRKHAIDKVLTTRKSAATEPIILVQEQGEQKAFLLFEPVFSDRGEVFGLISTVFRVEDLVRSSLPELSLQDYEVIIDDVTDREPKNLMGSVVNADSIYRYVDTFSFGQREWRISVAPSQSLVIRLQSWWVWFVLMGAFFLVIILGVFLLFLLSKTAEIELEVASKTHALNNALKHAKLSSEVKSAFLASMSHELRTPLNSIIGFSARLQKKLQGQIDQRYLDYMGIIHKNGESLLHMVNDLLDLSKVEAGKMSINKTHFEVDKVVVEVMESLTPSAENKKILLQASASPIENLFSDRQRFVQVLTNLLSNAIKFSSSGVVAIHFQVKRIAQMDGLEMEVRDSGKGISAEDIPKLFRRYEQLGDTFQGGQMGTGLGLALVQELVKMQGGQVSVISKVGKGSSFFVWFPTAG